MEEVEKYNYSVTTENRFFDCNYSNEINISVTENKTSEIIVSGGKTYCFFKRTFDILASGCFLLCFGWFIALLFIKFCEDGYNPIYTSFRVGKNNEQFKFHKIRSMVPHVEFRKQKLINEDKNEADDLAFRMKNYSGITRFKKFLRKTFLDGIPQIWDIFIGKMSVVGTKSHLPNEVEKYRDYRMYRLYVKGGFICTWQITTNKRHLFFDELIKFGINILSIDI